MFKKTGALIVSLLLFNTAMVYGDKDRPPAGFQQCVKGLEEKARAAGISAKTIAQGLGSVQFIARTLELDRKQPEFNETFAGYLNKQINDFRIEQGRQLLKDYRPLLDRLTRQYGVPQHVLVAFWGLETNYGAYLGKFPVLDTLATLACDPRRSAYFTGELLDALRLMEKHGFTPGQMLGSWAGAMGQTQFMPSAFLRYGIDADKDGKVNLWESIPDALTSAANFLSQLGWQRNWKWGREVSLPKDFDYLNSGIKNKKTVDEWRRLGVTTVFGGPIPASDEEAELVIPAGHQGPAFLVYSNFHVIMGWNRSVFYALAVGHLADRLNGSQEFHRPPPVSQPRLNTDQVRALQEKLTKLGFDSGSPDGILGPATRRAIRDFQRKRGMVADGYPGKNLFDALDIRLQDS